MNELRLKQISDEEKIVKKKVAIFGESIFIKWREFFGHDRTSVLKWAMFLAFFIIIAKLFMVQVIQYDEYAQKARRRQMKSYVLAAQRGEVYLKDGDNAVSPVVMNERVWTIYLDPKYIGAKRRKETERQLGKILGDDMELPWRKVWSDKNRQYIEVAHDVDFKKAQQIDKAHLRGVGKKESMRRVYPMDELAAQVLGFINKEGVGYGIEDSLNKQLAGKDGLLKTVKDVSDIPLTIGSNNVEIAAENGKDMVLSIDENIQRKVEEFLANGVKRSGGAKSASALVLNPNNGQIMALANMPSYNPAAYNKVKDANLFKNNISDDPYEAASICKTFTYAVALDTGAIKPSDTYVNTGKTRVEDREIKNVTNTANVMGKIDFATAIAYSLNTGSVEVLRRIGGGKITKAARTTLYDYLHNRFGLGTKTGVELYEEQGRVISPEEAEGNAVRYSNMTFGQGMNTTMVQIATAFAAAVNGGHYYKPTLVAGEMRQGVLHEYKHKKAERQVISEETSQQLRQLLMGVRAVNGGKKDPAGYDIGIKTGTAETYDKSGKYTSDATVAGVAGFGGRKGEKPQYVILVRLRGNRLLWGSQDAEPIFSDINNYMLKYLRINPEVD